jgi:hypothetical protein
MIPPQTIVNANSVPILHSSAAVPISINPAKPATTAPVMHCET